MLILTRKPNETLMIGDDVTVTVLGINGNQVKIGIAAPHDTAVHREEIYLKIKESQQDETIRSPNQKHSKDSQKYFNL